MGLFNKKNEGGLMDAIRCDQSDYLIWKWRPKGMEANSTKKENAIRYGSSLNVKDGEVAVFVYHQKDGTQQDFIEGPYNDTIKTANFPVLSSIVGLAFGGGSPFQAEVYYINQAGLIQVPFAVPYFDMFDPRVPEFPVQMAVRGSFAIGIPDYRQFIKLHRLTDFNIDAFKKQIKDSFIKYVKAVVTNIPDGSYGGAPIPLVQLERRILQVNDIVQQYVEPKLTGVYGVALKDFNISELDIDKTCDGYLKVKELTADYTAAQLKTQQDINISNMQQTNQLQMDQLAESQRIQMQNMEETMRIQREEAQFAQHQNTEMNAYAAKLATESQNLGAFSVGRQADVGIAAAEAMGKQAAAGAGNINLGAGGGGMNPGAMMANMAMGQAVGMGMANMLGNTFAGATAGMGTAAPGMAAPGMGAPVGGMPGQMPPAGMTPPPVPGAAAPATMYNVAVNGATTGPFSVAQLSQMAQAGQLTAQSLVWCAGMAGWAAASSVPELAALFAPPAPAGGVPPVPPVPPTPPVPPVQ